MITYIGGPGDDFAVGDFLNENLMFGLGGQDTLIGGNVSDRLIGGNGNDILDGDGGHDFLWGQAGDDLLFGGFGFGRDMLAGGAGNDTLDGEAGADRQYGEAGDDTLVYDAGDVVMNGGVDEDTLQSTGDITLGLGNVENMEIIHLSDPTTNQLLQGSGSYTEIDLVVPTVDFHPNLVTPDDVSSATDARNTLEVRGDAGDRVLLDTDWTWDGVNGDSENVFIGHDSSGATVTLNIDLDVTYGLAP